MELFLYRYDSKPDFTHGLFFIKNEMECFIIEDEYRTRKVYGETRIESGRYEIKFRTVGGFHQRYLQKFGPDFHKGMLELQNVPNFKYVLIHIGNDDDDTHGCLLVGSSVEVGKNFIGGSTKAYKRLYPKIANKLLSGERVFINIKDVS